MSQRFNAPPGWQVPEGFVPPTGWQPDPSWPPAPAGWNYWVDDAGAQPAPASAPAAGAPAPGGYGPAAPGGYGEGPSHAPGSANAALFQKQVKDSKRLMYIGFGVAVAGLLVWVITYGIAASSPSGGTYIRPWYLCLIGIALGIRGAISTSKAKKAAAQVAGPAAGMAGAYGHGPASSAPMPPAGPGPQQQMPAQPPAPGQQPQAGNPGEDGGQRPMGDVYR